MSVQVHAAAYLVGDLLGLLLDLIHLPADEALDGEEGVLRVHHSLALGDLWSKRARQMEAGVNSVACSRPTRLAPDRLDDRQPS